MSIEGRFRGRIHWQLWIAIAAFCLASAWFVTRVFWPSATTLTHGFGAYYSASRLLSNGELTADIYDPAYFRPIVRQDSGGQVDDIYNANPPTTTLLLWPLAYLHIEPARLLWTLANTLLLFAALALLLRAFCRPIRNPHHWPLYLATFTFALLFQPAIQNFKFGQAYILIFFLLTLTTIAFIRNQSTLLPITNYERRLLPPITQVTAGISLALALLLKTTGWPLLILLLWLRKGRFLAGIIISTLVISLATFPIFPLEMWSAYVRLLAQVGRSPLICVPAYQTTRSWLCHLLAPNILWQEAQSAGIAIPAGVTPIFFVLGITSMVLLLNLARKRPLVVFLSFICWSVLFLPLGEVHHHTILLIPFVWFIARCSTQSTTSRMLVLASAICYLIPFPVNTPLFQSGWQALFAYPYLLGSWLIFLGILWDHKSEMIPRPEPRQ
jgi:hypothetical protein